MLTAMHRSIRKKAKAPWSVGERNNNNNPINEQTKITIKKILPTRWQSAGIMEIKIEGGGERNVLEEVPLKS